MKRQQVTQARLQELFEYLPLEGCFLRLTRHSGYQQDKIFGTPTSCGHLCIVVDGVQYFIHNLIWLYVTGCWPNPMLDHKNTDGFNNKWTNLREATQAQNNANQRKRTGTSSIYKGVTYVSNRNKWQASLKINGRSLFLGRFLTEEAAAAAYTIKAKEVFGEFARSA